MSSSEQADDMAEFYEVGQSAQSGHKPLTHNNLETDTNQAGRVLLCLLL